jgi:hypothetical protein
MMIIMIMIIMVIMMMMMVMAAVAITHYPTADYVMQHELHTSFTHSL